ncbi:MAG: hypothetical protein WCE94_09980 [Candidatus Methanoperedens sp.]
MSKFRWVIDANILGNVCRKKADNAATIKFLTQVKKHLVVVNKEIKREYKPMPYRENIKCDQNGKKFLQEWLIELYTKFSIAPPGKLLELPLFIANQPNERFKEEDRIYVKLAISTDKLLVASETHFQNVKECLEENKIRFFNETEALDFLYKLK